MERFFALSDRPMRLLWFLSLFVCIRPSNTFGTPPPAQATLNTRTGSPSIHPIDRLSVIRGQYSTCLYMSSVGSLGKGLRKKKLKSFNRYLEIEGWKRAELRDLEPVLQAVAEACKQINRIVQRAKTDDLYGVAVGVDGTPLDGTNIQGEVQQKLDVLCNSIMLRAFCGASYSIHSVASEEEDQPRCCSDVMVRSILLSYLRH